MKIRILPLVAALALPVAAQTPPSAGGPAPNAAITGLKGPWSRVKDILVRAAEKMPEENYGFKPAETVRSFGQIVGHVADSQYYFCSVVLGDKNPGLQIEKTKTSKADLIGALKAAFAYCDKAYDGLTEASGGEMVKLFKGDLPKRDALTANALHGVEHYGNLIVYLRMKNIVPPSSEPGFMQEPKNAPSPKSTVEPKK